VCNSTETIEVLMEKNRIRSILGVLYPDVAIYDVLIRPSTIKYRKLFSSGYVNCSFCKIMIKAENDVISHCPLCGRRMRRKLRKKRYETPHSEPRKRAKRK
jgi:hypothetical protein